MNNFMDFGIFQQADDFGIFGWGLGLARFVDADLVFHDCTTYSLTTSNGGLQRVVGEFPSL